MDINQAWKNTCKVILGEEIGDLEQYRGYLLKHTEALQERKSAVSGKGVVTPATEPYPKEAEFISKEEEEEYGRWLSKQTAMSINQVKDLDSALEAMREKLYFCGDVVLGNSSNVEQSTDVMNSHYVYCSWLIRDGCKYVAFTSNVRRAEFCFGSTDGGQLEFLVKGYDPYMNTRCFEALRSKPLSDSYYVANLQACKNCMFSFNLRNKNYAIGNLQMGKEAYGKLKAKLIVDIRETLKARKEVPTLIDIIGQGAALLRRRADQTPSAPKKKVSDLGNMAPIQRVFSKTCEIIFGKDLGHLQDYGPWLGEFVAGVASVNSCVSGKPFFSPDLHFYRPICKRMVTLGESLGLGEERLEFDEVEKLSLENAGKALSAISATTPEVIFGSNINMIDSVDYQDAANSYRGSHVFFSKNSAFTHFNRESESVFGTHKIIYSNNCIRCKNSTSLARCFEVIDSYSCADSYFCHNSENLQDCMFCFNAKNLRHAIGNLEVGKEKYAEIRGRIMERLAKELLERKRLDLNVYNAGNYHGRQ